MGGSGIMASILKVDQIQLSDGSTPTAGDLGIDVAGSVVQVQHALLYSNNTPSTSTTQWANSGFGCQITPKFATSKLIVHIDFTVGTANGGRPYVGIGRDNNAPDIASSGTPSYIKWETDYSWPAASQHASLTASFDANSTAPTTMGVWIANDTGGTTYLNRNGNGQAGGTTQITIYEIAQ
jgi:hypothetical protein